MRELSPFIFRNIINYGAVLPMYCAVSVDITSSSTRLKYFDGLVDLSRFLSVTEAEFLSFPIAPGVLGANSGGLDY